MPRMLRDSHRMLQRWDGGPVTHQIRRSTAIQTQIRLVLGLNLRSGALDPTLMTTLWIPEVCRGSTKYTPHISISSLEFSLTP